MRIIKPPESNGEFRYGLENDLADPVEEFWEQDFDETFDIFSETEAESSLWSPAAQSEAAVATAYKRIYPLPILVDGRRPGITSGHYHENPSRKPRSASHPKGKYDGHQGADLMYPYRQGVDPSRRELESKNRIDGTGKYWSPEHVWVTAYAKGQVRHVGERSNGWRLYIRHPDGLESAYRHLTKPIVKNGDYVKAGDRLAQLDRRGSPAHLHFEIRLKGRYKYEQSVNPRRFLEGIPVIKLSGSDTAAMVRPQVSRPAAKVPGSYAPAPSRTARPATTRTAPTSSVSASVPQPVVLMLRFGLEAQAIRLAVHWGIRDENKLTNLVFFNRHPERRGRKITKGEPNFNQLGREWIEIRNDLVRPALAEAASTRSAPTSPTPSGRVEIISVRKPKLKGLEPGVRTQALHYFKPEGDPRDIILAATASTEGGYDTVNMYDVGIVSWGIMQWTVHQGSLQGMLAYAKRRLSEMSKLPLWNQLFPGLDVGQISGKIRLIYRGTPVVSLAQMRQLFRGDKRRGRFQESAINRWAKIFALAGRHPIMQQLQREYARRKVDEELRKNLGTSLSYLKGTVCSKRSLNSFWRWACPQLPEPAQNYRLRYGRISNYVGGDLKASTLFFGMSTNNPTAAILHLKDAIDNLAHRYGSHDHSRWPSGWKRELSAEFERLLRASRFATWGDAKARAAKRKSRTQKILDTFHKLHG